MTRHPQRTSSLRTTVVGGVVRLEGELDLSTCDDAQAAFEEAIASGEAIVVELQGLSFCDSQGLHTLVQLASAARVAERRVTLRRPAVGVARLLAYTGVARLFDLEPDLSELPEHTSGEGGI